MLERLPVVPSGKLIDALRTGVATVGRANAFSIEACRVAPADDTGTTTGVSNDALAAPV